MITKEDINLLKRFFAEKGQKVYQTISSIISWTNIAGKPLEFPPEAHTHLEADITDLQDYALKSNVLELDNITAFTPDTDYEPATKKYVDDNSGLVGTKEVDEINIADTKILEYDSTSDKLIYVAKPTGGGGFFNKLDATTNPTVNDDSVDGYEVGSLWFNVTTSKVFQCLNATTGAAVWVELTGSGGGVSVTNFTNYQNLLDDTSVGDGNFGTVTNLLNSIFIKFTDWYALGRKIIWKVTANTKWYLPFEDNVNDLSGNGYNATATDITYVTGKVGAKAASFNGTTSKASYAGCVTGTSITNITMMCWVYLSSTSLKGTFLGTGSNPGAGGDNSKGFGLGVGSTDFTNNGNNLIAIWEAVRWIPTGKPIGTGWHHVALTINNSSKPTMYIDGVQIYTDTGTDPAAPTTTSPSTNVGASNTVRFFTGYIDEAIIESRLWTSQEIFEYFMQTQ